MKFVRIFRELWADSKGGGRAIALLGIANSILAASFAFAIWVKWQ